MAICFESEFESAWQDTSKEMITVKTGDWRSKRPQLVKEVCRQCGNCYVFCPLGCYEPGEDGYFHPDLDYCKGCGVCAYECPAHAIKMVQEEED